MREIYAEIARRLRTGRRCAVATLSSVSKGSPSPIGTSLLVDIDGSFIGNIGAGCHEAEIVESARRSLSDGEPRTIEFTLADEVFDGSVCGASLTVEVWVPDRNFIPIADAIVAGREAVAFSCGSQVVTIEAKRRLLIVGATDLAANLTRLANAADFSVTVADPRPEFATRTRHPDAHRVLVAWPDDVLDALLADAAAIVVVAHDAKIDLPAVGCALRSNVAYIGVLGNRRSQRARAAALRNLGYHAGALARVPRPAGLDQGGPSNAQVACSILAEMLCVLNERSGEPLRSIDGPIHPAPRLFAQGPIAL
jgi:xanthine dehydrogenase accessory factor